MIATSAYNANKDNLSVYHIASSERNPVCCCVLCLLYFVVLYCIVVLWYCISYLRVRREILNVVVIMLCGVLYEYV